MIKPTTYRRGPARYKPGPEWPSRAPSSPRRSTRTLANATLSGCASWPGPKEAPRERQTRRSAAMPPTPPRSAGTPTNGMAQIGEIYGPIEEILPGRQRRQRVAEKARARAPPSVVAGPPCASRATASDRPGRRRLARAGGGRLLQVVEDLGRPPRSRRAGRSRAQPICPGKQGVASSRRNRGSITLLRQAVVAKERVRRPGRRPRWRKSRLGLGRARATIQGLRARFGEALRSSPRG